MKLPKWTIVASGLLMMMVLGACGSKYGSPEAAAETFFDAYEAKDTDAIKEAICEQYQDGVPDFEGLEDLTNGEIEFEFDVRFNEDDDTDTDKIREDDATLADVDEVAVVDIYGTIRQRLVTDESDTETKTHSRDDNPLLSIVVIKDGDDWKVCDNNVFGALN